MGGLPNLDGGRAWRGNWGVGVAKGWFMSQTSLQIQVLQDIPELDPRFAFFPLVTSLLGDPFLLVGLFWISVPWVRAEN